MLNRNYRVATDADLIVGAEVFCYYVTPTPAPASLGTVVSAPDREGWVDVVTVDGAKHNFNADRLGVLR